MTPTDLDALVNIVRDAIDQRTEKTRLALDAHLSKALATIKAQADQLSELRDQLKSLPVPKDGTDATPAMVAESLAKYLEANPIPVPVAPEAPAPLSPTAEQVSEAVKGYMAAHPVKAPEPLAPVQSDIEKAVSAYIAANPLPTAPEPLSPTMGQISDAVKGYMEANPIDMPAPLSPSMDMVSKSVAEYMAANPVPIPEAPKPIELTSEQLDAAISKHFAGFEIEVPEPSPVMIAESVQKYFEANPVKVPEAPAALSPTDEQVSRVVNKHLSDNPPAPGARGLDALEIVILPSINQERSYAKGTYARWGGGVIRALRDTEPGNPIETGCWDVVMDGVKAIEVHPLGGAEFAVKSIMTGGASHIAKMSAPTFDDSYKDIWKESAGEYKRGDIVTHKGSVWLAKSTTLERPGTGEGWKLIVKAGKDGRDLSLVKLERPATYKLAK